MVERIHCTKHDFTVLVPETDYEHENLVAEITKLLKHFAENPTCIFRRIES